MFYQLWNWLQCWKQSFSAQALYSCSFHGNFETAGRVFVILCWHTSKNTYKNSFRVLGQIFALHYANINTEKSYCISACVTKTELCLKEHECKWQGIKNTDAEREVHVWKWFILRSSCWNKWEFCPCKADLILYFSLWLVVLETSIIKTICSA